MTEFQFDFEHPFRRFKGKSVPKAAPMPDPAPKVVELNEDVKQKDAAKRRQRIIAMGRASTLLTEQTNNQQGKATLLGRTV